MLIIVEGPDGAGKTSFVETLNHELDLRGDHRDRALHHARPPKQHPLDEYVTPLLNFRPGQDVALCDRWHWGEVVYPYVLGRSTHMTSGVLRYIELFLRSRGAMIVHMNPPVQTLNQRVRARGDDFIHVDLLPRLHQEYQRLANRSLISVVSATLNASMVLTAAAQAGRPMAELSSFTTYIGSRFPRYVLVGDKRSTLDVPGAPAFMPYQNTSGHFLMTALASANVARDRWLSLGIANANDVDDIRKLHHVLGHPRMIALGRVAEATLRRENLWHATVPHPQFVRRFYHREDIAYGQVLWAATINEGDYGAWRP